MNKKTQNDVNNVAPGQVFLKPDLSLGTYEGPKESAAPLPASKPAPTFKYSKDTLYSFMIEGKKKTYQVLGINAKNRLILYNVDTDTTITITEQYFQFWLRCKLIEKIKKSV